MNFRVFSSSAILLCTNALVASAWAQAVPASTETPEAAIPRDDAGAEIIVTARKRNETSIQVPVSMLALGREQLERYGASDLLTLSSQTPGLVVTSANSGSGGGVAVRGVTTGLNNPSTDQAVSFVIDSVPVGTGHFVRLGLIDLQQMEVLKGPQALFFGKNSPGGIISMRSADPGAKTEFGAKVDYEFEAREKTAQFIASGPITDELGVRAVVAYRDMEGYIVNKSPLVPNLAFEPSRRRNPAANEIFVRGTALYRPSSDLLVRAKYSYNRLKGSSTLAMNQRIYCPRGAPQVVGLPVAVDDCKPDFVNYVADPSPNIVAQFPGSLRRNGLGSRQHLGGLEINYNVAPQIAFTSVSGIYDLKERNIGDATYMPVALAMVNPQSKRRELSQEIRLVTSRSDWPVNFTIGAFYQDLKYYNRIDIILDNFALGAAPAPGTGRLTANSEFRINGTAYSFFGQGLWAITPQLELAGGARWSKEKKKLSPFQRGILLATAKPNVSFDNLSPEVTLSWRPDRQLNIFGAFRNGFRSGGFNTANTGGTPNLDLSYRPEKARGFEAGIKGVRGAFRFGLTGYTYRYSDLQVSAFNPVTLVQNVSNAGAARIKGIEAELGYRPSELPGFEIHGSANYNKARYTFFIADCFTGQTIAEGCNLVPKATGQFQKQDLKGRPLRLAPTWTGAAGFSYSTDLPGGKGLTITADANYNSGYWTNLSLAAGSHQDDYVTLSASARLRLAEDRFELALIGENLTNQAVFTDANGVSLTGVAARTGTATAGGQADLAAPVLRGRQIRLQGVLKF
ncbi:TonB-dependent receptor [Rhizorhabdus argentea]|uniref:TonB-dependent receptor n=1 Tax=Rhizorhabdus argentea TaxID=1387174 RepID=UPI0030EB7900